MTWRTHFLGGIAALWILPPGVGLDSLALAVLFAALGSLLPDIDARESKIASLQIGGVTWLKPAAHLAYRRLGHRGALHSIVALLVLSIAAGVPLWLFLSPLAAVGLALGYLSHLLLDACTRSGVPLYWPDTNRVHLLPMRLRITTGSRAEDGVFLLLALAALGLLLTHLTHLNAFPYAPDTLTTF